MNNNLQKFIIKKLALSNDNPHAGKSIFPALPLY